MNRKVIYLGAAFVLTAFSCLANEEVLHERRSMEPLYTDASMTTLKPMEEFKAAFFSLPAEKQGAMKDACARQVQQPFTAFCANVNTLGGHN
ncbi:MULTISPECIES: hypothetical protein [Mesorhizobium]|uniref:hypothetical protein n=1 Tax=Mesorhizobium TaxID=68287 RepID=UPI0003CE336F|nr:MULTISPECIES: hypothetical protein [Mesorhizobium]ESY68921.1 hypothetical protein X742_09960 [Mesorhizobium sp. LNHC232B00]WJI40615.1 hypothetical protein NL534_10365 [Mesorhizobium opportunistum]